MFKPKSPKILTAIGFINFNNIFTKKGMMITGDNHGNVVFTNWENNSQKKINKTYLPEGSPAITSITTKFITVTYAKVIIGFANGSFCIFGIWMKGNKGTPTNCKNPLRIDLSAKGSKDIPGITGVTIINETSIAVGLSVRQIRLIDFKPNFNDFTFPDTNTKTALFKAVSVNDAVCPTIPCTTTIKSTAILSTPVSPGIVMHHVYVLTTSNQLQLFKYDQMFGNPGMGIVADGVANIAAPGIGCTNLVFTKLNGSIWQTSPILNTPIKEFGTLPGRKPITPASVMTLHGDILYYATLAADNKTVEFDWVQLPASSPAHTTPPVTIYGPTDSSSPSSSGHPVNAHNIPPNVLSSSNPPTPPPLSSPSQPPPNSTQYVDLEAINLFNKQE